WHAGRTYARILAGTANIGHHGGNAGCRRAMQCICHQQQFHQAVVCWCAGGLDNEYVLATDILAEFDADLAITESLTVCAAEWHTKPFGHFMRQLGIGIATENHQIVRHGYNLGPLARDGTFMWNGSVDKQKFCSKE